MSITTVQTVPRDPAVQAVFNSMLPIPSSTLLERAHSRTSEQRLCYVGGLTPAEAWALVSRGNTVLVDVCTAEERKFVGRMPDTPHAAQRTGLAMIKNPRFLWELEKTTPKGTVVLLLHRNDKRSAVVTEAAATAGSQNVFNMLEGFEDDLGEQQQRDETGG